MPLFLVTSSNQQHFEHWKCSMNFPQNELTIQISTPEKLGNVKPMKIRTNHAAPPKTKMEFSLLKPTKVFKFKIGYKSNKISLQIVGIRVAQRKRGGPITHRSEDRNLALIAQSTSFWRLMDLFLIRILFPFLL